MEDLQAVFGSSSRYGYPEQQNRSPSTASFTSASSPSSSGTATPRHNRYAPPPNVSSRISHATDHARRYDTNKQVMDEIDVDILPLADLLGPMGDDQKQFEEDLDADMRSFQNTQSTFSEDGAVGRGVNGSMRGIFGDEGDKKQRHNMRDRRSSSPVNSAFDPHHDDMDNTLSTMSSIEIGRSAPAVHRSQHHAHHPIPSVNIQSPSHTTQPRSRPNIQTRTQSRKDTTYDANDQTKHIGASPASTMGHHVSRLSNGLGPNGWMANGGKAFKGREVGWEDEEMTFEDENGDGKGGEEYDQDRSVRRLLDELQNAGRAEAEAEAKARGSRREKENAAPPALNGTQEYAKDVKGRKTSQSGLAAMARIGSGSGSGSMAKLNVFAPTTSSSIIDQQASTSKAQQHRPKQGSTDTAYRPLKPSPLQQATHHNTGGNRTISASSSAGGIPLGGLIAIGAGQSASFSTGLRAENQLTSRGLATGQGVFESGGTVSANGGDANGYPYQDTPVPVRGRRSASSSMLVAGEKESSNGFGGTQTTKRASQTSLPQAPKPQTQNSSQRVRIVSDPDTKSRQQRQDQSAGDARGAGQSTTTRKTEGWEMDLTRLTDLCRTPGKGDSFVAVGENAAPPGIGARIPKTLNDVHHRMQALQDDCENSKKRVRELEIELEQCKIEASEIAREGEDRRLAEVAEWRSRYEAIRKEKEGLEQLLAAATSRIVELERQQRVTTAEVANLREELKIRMTPRKVRPAQSAAAIKTGSQDLRPAVEKVINRLDRLESEVLDLKGIVDEAIDWRHNVKAERSFITYQQVATNNSQLPIDQPTRQLRDEPHQSSQYRDGLKTAAYEGTARKSNPLHAIVESEIDDGESSPSPYPSLTSRSMQRADHYLNSAQKTRRVRLARNQSVASSPGNRSHGSAVSRSDDPQNDPSTEAFPAIRGDRLEEEFFAFPGAGLQDVDGAKPAFATGPAERRPDKASKLESSLKSPTEKLPAATHIIAVLQELEEDFNHYLSIYTDLADQYKRMHPTNTKRNILAEHLKGVIDTMEGKANQVARLTEVLDAPLHGKSDKTYRAPMLAVDKTVSAAARASKRRMMMAIAPENLAGVVRDVGSQRVEKP